MVDIFIKILYENLFGFTYKHTKLYYKNKIISTNKNAIIIFLGLCFSEYKKGFKNSIEIYEYIKGSHYFNIDFFKSDKKFFEFYLKNPKKNEFNYKEFDSLKKINQILSFFERYE